MFQAIVAYSGALSIVARDETNHSQVLQLILHVAAPIIDWETSASPDNSLPEQNGSVHVVVRQQR